MTAGASCRVHCEMNIYLHPRIKKVLLVSGVALIGGALLLGIGMLSGLMPLQGQLIEGESTVHSVARVAIVGCLLAAIGSMD